MQYVYGITTLHNMECVQFFPLFREWKLVRLKILDHLGFVSREVHFPGVDGKLLDLPFLYDLI